MSTGLIDQLETYFSQLDRTQGTVSPDLVAERLDSVRELPERPARPWFRLNVGVAVAAAAVVLLVLGLLPFLFTVGDDAIPPATTVSTLTPTTISESATSTPPSTSTTVVEIEASPGIRVEDLPDGGSAGWRWVSTGLAAYATGGNENIDGFIIGRFSDGTFFAWNAAWLEGGVYDGSLGDDPVETLLLSTDGVTWSPADLPFTDDAVSVGLFGSKFIIRTYDPGPLDVGTYDGEVHYWTTNDGIEWFEVPAALYFPWHEIGDTIVVNHWDGIAVSDDRGATFEIMQREQFADFPDRVLFVHGDSFRMLQWNGDDSPVPTLWGSQDGRTWSDLGPVPDLQDRGEIPSWDLEVLPGDRILLTAVPAEPDPGASDLTWSWWMVSDDGGRTWQELETAPTRRSATDERAPLAWRVTKVDGWTVFSTDQDLLATRDGNDWIRLDPPINGRPQMGVNSGGVVVASIRNEADTVMLWIALPPNE